MSLINKNFIRLGSTLAVVILSIAGVTSCDDSTSSEWKDYVNDSNVVRLKVDYKNKDFYNDGFGQVTLASAIDGDTAHFTPLVTTTSSKNIKARFYGIDTPESTGKVEEYGKAASYYTKGRLEKANKNGTIVVGSPSLNYTVPSTDSTGSRYLSLIWINETVKNANYTDLILLNLAIVQDGYSYVKNVAELPEYADTFYAAEEQAKAAKLNLFSGQPDPLFNYGEYETVSLLDIKREIEKTIKDSSYTNVYDGAKVRVVGTVAGFSNHVLYIQNYYTKAEGAKYDEGEYAGINIFVGMTAVSSKYTTKNAYIQLSGVASDSENFGFQISGCSFKALPKDENDVQQLIAPENNTEEYSLHTYEANKAKFSEMASSNNLDYLNCSVSLTDTVTVSKFYINDDGDEITLYFTDCSFQAFLTFSYRGDLNQTNWIWNKEEDFMGKKFNLSGVYTYHKTTSGNIKYQINPSSGSDLVWVE